MSTLAERLAEALDKAGIDLNSPRRTGVLDSLIARGVTLPEEPEPQERFYVESWGAGFHVLDRRSPGVTIAKCDMPEAADHIARLVNLDAEYDDLGGIKAEHSRMQHKIEGLGDERDEARVEVERLSAEVKAQAEEVVEAHTIANIALADAKRNLDRAEEAERKLAQRPRLTDEDADERVIARMPADATPAPRAVTAEDVRQVFYGATGHSPVIDRWGARVWQKSADALNERIGARPLPTREQVREAIYDHMGDPELDTDATADAVMALLAQPTREGS